jgi:hypothetical protein
MGLSYLDPADPGTYRAQRGHTGTADLMARDVGTGGRYVTTTGEGLDHTLGAAMAPSWRNVFDPHSVSFAVLVLGFVLFLIHARVDVAVRGALSK